MGLRKRQYTDRETLITAENLNDIQEAILELEDGLFSVDNDKSGVVITMTDAAKRSFRSLSIYGKTTQNGAPTPEAPVDLVSAGDNGVIGVIITTGKNLLAKPFLLGVHSQSGYSNANDRVVSTDGFFLKAGTYVVSGAINDSWTLYINGMANAKTTNGYQRNIPSRSFNIPSDGLYNIQFNRGDGNAFTDSELRKLNSSAQVEIGSTPTYYEPYNGQELAISTPNGLYGIPVASGGNYTDANGQQWVCDEIDFWRGVYVQRCFRETVELIYEPSMNRYTSQLSNYANGKFAMSNGIIVICDKLSFNENASATINGVVVSGVRGSVSNPKTLVAYYNGEDPGELDVVYPLATPIETPLPEEELADYAALHTYKDNTTVSNDGGAYMELEYVMDAKKYIDGLIADKLGG